MVFIRKIILSIVIIFIAGSVALLLAVKSADFWSIIIKFVVNRQIQKTGFSFKDVKVYQPQCSLEELKFQKINAWLFDKEHKYYIQIDRPRIEGVKSLIRKQKSLDIFLNYLKFESSDLNAELKYSEINLESPKEADNNFLLLKFKTDSILMNQLNCNQLSFSGEVYKSEMKGHDLQAACFEGKIAAQFNLSYAKMLTYQIDLSFQRVNLSALEKINQEVFSNLHGLIDGELRLAGDLNNVGTLESDLRIVSNGMVRAELLKALMPYIPQSTQRKDLENLIKQNGLVVLDKGVVHLKSVGDEKISSLVNLESRKLNLNTNLTLDVNVEGGIKNFYRHIIKTLK